MTLLYLYGFIRTLLIIAGIYLVLKLIGGVMIAKRNIAENEQLNRQQRDSDDVVSKANKNYGKTTISKLGKSKYKDSDFVDYEEIDED